MDRDKPTVSVIPYPIRRTSNMPLWRDDPAPLKREETAPVKREEETPEKRADASDEWDAKWLRPQFQVVQPPEKKSEPVVHEIRPSSSVWDPRPSPIAREPEPFFTEEPEPEPLSLPLRVLRWLFPDVNQRRAKRYPTPGLVAYYWTGGAPHSYQVGDMSATGLFLLTKERWAPGTLIQMTLQRQDGMSRQDESICVLSEVVRWGENGSGFNFVLSDYENVLDYGIQPIEAVNRKSVERFMHKIGVLEAN